MAPCSKKAGAASRVASEFVVPRSVSNSTKTTHNVTASPEATYCYYLGSLVTKLDRVARIPKVVAESAAA